jgi:hypothetical protein|nr:MAG TPA: RNA dependent RNA polymerase [Caudoviricetes sp.]
MNNLIENDILIRNMDASYLYWKIKDDGAIAEYENKKKELSSTDDQEVQDRVQELSKQIFSFGTDIKLPEKDNRYLYSGTLTDSLMTRKLRQVVNNKDGAIRSVKTDSTASETDYTDIIINLKFKSDVMIQTDEQKQAYNQDTGEIEKLDAKKSKRLISKKKLRQMAYRDGVTINGVHYVNFQRTSSKARTGNDLFIDKDYFEAMEEWQTMGIPFREIFKEDDKVDIVSTRSYEALTSSSIIGTLDIDPYSILLIDEADGTYTMPCNVVTLNEETKRLQVSKQDYEKHIDLWDGQSLADESIFNTGKYFNRKDGKEHTYEGKGFLLLRNHFFKSAIFNTKLQEYYSEKFKGVDNPVVKDRFGETFNPQDVKLVTTKNSVKILKFADIIATYMVADDEKEKLKELESQRQVFIDECSKIRNRVSTAKRNYKILLNSRPSTPEEIKQAEEELKVAEQKKDDKEISKAKKNLTKIINRRKATPEEIKTAQDEIIFAEEDQSRLPEIEAEIKKYNKPIKFEQEKLTWHWYREQLKKNQDKFGVCKYEKVSKFGERQQLWYQVLGSLNLNEKQLWQIVEPQVHEINLMKKYPAFLKHSLNTKAADTDNIGARMMKELLQVNEDITKTSWYTNYRRSYIGSILDRLYEGKVQLNNSDFCTLVANPYEMLRASIGERIDTSILSDFQCYCSRYADGEELYGFRSPHIAIGENAILTNTDREEWKWFNFTDRILVINLFGKGAFLSDIWQGCDTDSDVAYIGNDPVVLEATKSTVNSGKYLIPINGLSPENDPKNYTDEEMATIDGKLANDFIGKICNLARDLQCFYWHLYNTGTEENKKKYLPQIYDDICILAVASNIAIDSAKRRYKGVNLETEISQMKERPYLKIKGAILQNDGTIRLTERRYKKSLSNECIEKYEKAVKNRNEATTLEEVQKWTKQIDKLLMKEIGNGQEMVRPNFTKGLKSKPKKKKRHFENEAEKELYRQKQILASQERKELEEKIYLPLECSMDKLADVIKAHLERADRTKMITFTDILNRIPKGIKADYNRIEAIKKVGIEGNNELNKIYSKYANGDITYDEMYEQKQNTIQNILNKIRYTDIDAEIERKITTWDIQKLIRDVYDIHPRKDKHGKFVKDEKTGKGIMDDKRDKRLVGDRKKQCVGQKLLQWIYEVYPKEFIAAIRQNKGTVTELEEVTPENETSSKTSINSLKDLNKWLEDDGEIYELYGKKYRIKTKNKQ